jgi:multiple sugar transport system ATP-binding protein
MSVYKNLAFGPTVRGESKRDLRTRIVEVAEILGIESLLDRRPTQLSGGQRQRVALGRALLRQPNVFLLDEPLSNLDAAMRVQMRGELIRLHRRLPETTTVYVTHDQVEALTMGDRVAVLKDGEIMQVDTPSGLYDNPANVFVASFIGSPQMNLCDGELSRDGSELSVSVLGTRVSLTPDQAGALGQSTAERSLLVGLRPLDLVPAVELREADRACRLDAVIDLVEHTGSEVFATVRVANQSLVARFPRHPVPRSGDHVQLAFYARDIHLFAAGNGAALSVRGGALGGDRGNTMHGRSPLVGAAVACVPQPSTVDRSAARHAGDHDTESKSESEI